MRRSHAAVRSSRRGLDWSRRLRPRAAGRSGKHDDFSNPKTGQLGLRTVISSSLICPLFFRPDIPPFSKMRVCFPRVYCNRPGSLIHKTSDVFATSVFRFSARRRCVLASFAASDTQHTHRKMAAMTSTMMTLRVSAKAPVKASNKVRLKTRSRAPIAVWRRVHRLFAPSPFGGELRRREWTARGAMRPVATGSDGRE